MSLAQEIRDALVLTRPRQWPILATQFLVAVLLVSPAAAGGGCWYNSASAFLLLAATGIWVILLNGGTLAFNSAYDRDTTAVAYLPDPPPPPAWLAAASALFMGLGAVAGGLVVGTGFGLTVLVCVVLSVLYSHASVRLKSRPGLDLMVNMLGYGAATTLAGVLAGTAAHQGACSRGVWQFPDLPASGEPLTEQLQGALGGETGWAILAFGLLFGSFYPQTQIYQMKDDLARGDRTLVTALGARLALWLAVGLGLLAGLALARALALRGFTGWDLSAAVALLLWLGHLGRWLIRLDKLDQTAQEQHMYTALTLWAAVDLALVVSWIF